MEVARPAHPLPVYRARVETETELAPARRPLSARARAFVLGAAGWLWLLATLLPMLELGVGGRSGVLGALVFPATVRLGLALEVLAHGRSALRLRRLSDAVLLGVAPLGLVGSLSIRPELTGRDVLGPPHVALMIVATAFYLGSCAHLSALRATPRRARAQPLPPSARILEPRWPQLLRAALLAAISIGAVALVGVIPIAGGHALRVAHHGADGAETAALLAGAIATALGVVLLGAIVGPAMRARPPDAAAPSLRRRREAWAQLRRTVVALLALGLWIWLASARG